jgi:hypothetical protein
LPGEHTQQIINRSGTYLLYFFLGVFLCYLALSWHFIFQLIYFGFGDRTTCLVLGVLETESPNLAQAGLEITA